MNYWIFKCNPKEYRLDARLADSHPTISWRITRYRDEIDAGDIAFNWQTGPKRGFRAVFKLDCAPQIMPELKREQRYNRVRDTEELLRVTGKITERHMNLQSTILRATPGLEGLSMFHGFQQGTNFRMTKREAQIVFLLHAKTA